MVRVHSWQPINASTVSSYGFVSRPRSVRMGFRFKSLRAGANFNTSAEVVSYGARTDCKSVVHNTLSGSISRLGTKLSQQIAIMRRLCGVTGGHCVLASAEELFLMSESSCGCRRFPAHDASRVERGCESTVNFLQVQIQ